jgi:uncharacterized hydrophobic protein (TIGR00271 family)
MKRILRRALGPGAGVVESTATSRQGELQTKPQPEQGKPELAASEWRLMRRLLNALRTSIARLLRVSDERKPEIYAESFRAADFADLNYWLEIFFSIGIATLGLITNSPAVVIGAMLISPLMGPILSNGLAIALGDFYLGFKSLVNLFLSVTTSILIAALITWVLPFRAPTQEILARVQPTLLDLGIAVLSGMAGAIVVCRGGKGGGVTALPGVAVAVALMPPLGVVGFGVGIGWDWRIVSGGGLLFLTNLVAIILSSFLVFFAVRLDTPEVRRQINAWLEQEKKHETFYEFIDRTPLRRLLGRVGSLPRRALILFIFLAMVAFPLSRTLNQLRRETQIRRAVLDELHKAIPREAIFREDLEILPERVWVRVVAVLPGGFSSESRKNLENVIQARTELPAQVLVFDVATREELTAVTGRLMAPASAPIETVEEIRAKLLARVRSAVAASWPAEQAPLLGYGVTLGPGTAAPRLHIAYLGTEDLAGLGEAALRKSLGERLGVTAVEVQMERVAAEWHLALTPGRDVLPPAGQEALDQVAAYLDRFPGARCRVVPAAEDGKESTELDNRRAENVRKYLLEVRKAAPERVEVTPGKPPAPDRRTDRNMVVIQLLPPAQLP